MTVIKVKTGKDQLIAIDEILKLLNSNSQKLTLVFESGKVNDKYRKELQKELTKYHVFNSRWLAQLWIYPALETARILALKNEIHSAAVSFRSDAVILIKALGETYQIDPFEQGGLLSIKKKSRANKQRGKVNDEWNFWFHGAECQFKNHKTGQIVELVITYGTEFGALDSYFFLTYLQTTSKFKALADFFSEDLTSVTKALNLLEDLGMLHRINDESQRGVVAKAQ